MQSWAREPFTLFRDYYLQAVLYSAESERKTGDAEEDASKQQEEHYKEAGRLFVVGALAACDSRVFGGRFDMKVSFVKTGRRAGAHVILSEQMLRRGIALYGKIGSTTLANRAYADYEQQMAVVSGRTWVVHPETVKDLEFAIAQTGAYRFPAGIATPYALANHLADAESASV